MEQPQPTWAEDVRLLLDKIGAAVLTVDRNGTVVYANGPTGALVGADPSALVGTVLTADQWRLRDREGRLLTPEELPLGRALRGESVAGCEVVVDGADGVERVVLTHAEPLTDECGVTRWAVATMHDVTDVVGWQAEVVANRSRLSAIVDNAMEPIVLVDDDARYVAANPAAERLLDHEPGGLVGVALTDVVVTNGHPSDQLEAFVAAGTAEQVVTLRRSDGTVVEVEARSVAHIEPGIHLSVWRDVTARNRALEDLAASQAQLDAIVEGVAVGLLLVDGDGRIEHANRVAQEILGTVVTGVDVTAALASLTGDLDAAVEVLRVAARTSPEELIISAADGRHLRLLATPIHGDARILHLEDVTARRDADQQLRDAFEREQHASEELSQLAHLKDTFLSAVSHELRTPLTAMQGFAATLQAHHAVLSERQLADMLERLRVNGRRLEGLLDDLLDLDRLRRGVQIVQATGTGLVDVVEGGLASVDLGAHQLVLDVQDVRCSLDRAKVERVIENLAMNATRHTPPGTTVRVSAQRPDDVVLRVEDDGPGVSAAVRERVFDMFAKGESPEARATGTGMGLALVREFVGLMDGSIQLTDSPLGGAAFEVRIPQP